MSGLSRAVTVRRLDDVVILDLAGRITIGEGSVVLRNQIQELLKSGDRHFLLNLSEVNYIDSARNLKAVRMHFQIQVP